MNFFQSPSNLSQAALGLAGSVSPTIVNAVYPMEALTAWHHAHHIRALTGRWMDCGPTYLSGITRGTYHRLQHGHHLFEDGFRVVVNPKLKFGEFLHHLGLDSLTTRGIPNPLLPTALKVPLEALGFSKHFVNELMTLNVPKILGGSLGLIVAGNNVYLAFSDAIPHTFSAAGVHLLIGSMNTIFGMFPPNFLLLTAGVAQFGVTAITAYRAVVDPVLPFVNVPGSVYFPLLGSSILTASLLGACTAYWTGASWSETMAMMSASVTATATSTTVSLAANGTGFLAPFLGPAAGIATALLIHKVLSSRKQEVHPYLEYATDSNLQLFPQQAGMPIFGCPRQPIGLLKDERFLLDEKAIANEEASFLDYPPHSVQLAT